MSTAGLSTICPHLRWILALIGMLHAVGRGCPPRQWYVIYWVRRLPNEQGTVNGSSHVETMRVSSRQRRTSNGSVRLGAHAENLD